MSSNSSVAQARGANEHEARPVSPARKSIVSIRAAMTVAFVVLGIVVAMLLLAIGALLWQLRTTTHTLDSAVREIRIAESIAGDLLQHSRSTSAPLQATTEGEIASLLRQARRFSTGPSENEAIDQLDAGVNVYFSKYHSARSSGLSPEQATVTASRELARAFAAVRRYSDFQVEQASEAEARAGSFVSVAIRISVLSWAITALVTIVGVLWIRRAAFQPVLKISMAMQRFSAGETTTRAPVEGPEELRTIARRFNDMATDLSHLQERQLAFVAGVVHDLRNPLSALQLSAVRLDPKRGPVTPEQARALGELINRQLEALNRMTGDLLEAARIGSGRLDLVLGDRDLRELARESVALFRSAAPSHLIELGLPEEPVLVHCDPVRIEQVLNNLLSNAIKYSPGGSRVEVRVDSRADEAVISVADEGVGISPEDLPHIFEPFRRTGASRESVRGVGLGLFVSKRIVEAHGGALEVQSAHGKGSTFTIRLPLGATASLQPAQQAPSRGPGGPNS